MPKTAASKRKQREWLFREQGGRCYWCGVEMVMPGPEARHQTHPLNEATIDHLFSRLSPDRGKVRGRVHVLACWGCNHARARLEDAALPLEERWRRSGAYPYGARVRG